MRKPAEIRSDADLQAIQTSVAFKNISDAIEQYRRQFGLAFLALIAFSAIHVGLVVIANLYTLETRVSNGVLSSTADTSAAPTPVATAAARQTRTLEEIMTTLEPAEQRRAINSISSIDFVDSDGNYRKYTVTGFQLGGAKNSSLKLYTAVGHVLEYVRGKGLRVTMDEVNGTQVPAARKTLERRALQRSGPRSQPDVNDLWYRNQASNQALMSANRQKSINGNSVVDYTASFDDLSLDAGQDIVDAAYNAQELSSASSSDSKSSSSSSISSASGKGSSGEGGRGPPGKAPGKGESDDWMEDMIQFLLDYALEMIWATNTVTLESHEFTCAVKGVFEYIATDIELVNAMPDCLTIEHLPTFDLFQISNGGYGGWAQLLAKVEGRGTTVTCLTADTFPCRSPALATYVQMELTNMPAEMTAFQQDKDALTTQQRLAWSSNIEATGGWTVSPGEVNAVMSYFVEYGEILLDTLPSNVWGLSKMSIVNPYMPVLGSFLTTPYLPELYGCTGMTMTELQHFDTKISYETPDACSASWLDYEQPNIMGFHFSVTLGVMEQFYLFTNLKYCNLMMNVVIESDGQSGGDEALTSGFDSMGITIFVDYLSMLHGFMGAADFLVMSSQLLQFANTGGTNDYMLSKENDFNAGMGMPCVNGLVVLGCVSYVAPGGFMVIAPNVWSTPLGGKVWYYNSEFAGFTMDYIAMELPCFVTVTLGILGRASGFFGFSMGGMGTMNVMNYYPDLVTAAAAYNGPMYPNTCMFSYTCAESCSHDFITCELLYSTVGMIFSAYVIMYAGATVMTTSSIDPVGEGVVANMMFKQTLNSWSMEETSLQCMGTDAYASNQPVQSMNSALRYGLKNNDMDTFASQTWQNWAPNVQCNVMTMKFAVGFGLASFPSGSAMSHYMCGDDSHHDSDGVVECDYMMKSYRVMMMGYSLFGTNYQCAMEGSVITLDLKSDKWSGGAFENCPARDFIDTRNLAVGMNSVACPMFFCPGIEWSYEINLSEGPKEYLSAVSLLVGLLYFVPISSPVEHTPVYSAFAKLLLTMPLIKIANDYAIFSISPVIFYLHCSQNDEYGLFEHHGAYSAILSYLASADCSVTNTMVSVADEANNANAFASVPYNEGDPCMTAGSLIAMDFQDCDWHSFSQRDLKTSQLWFSDSLRVMSVGNDLGGNNPWSGVSNRVSGSCYLSKFSMSPNYMSAGGTCQFNLIASVGSGFPDAYSEYVWHLIHIQNEAEADLESLQDIYDEFDKATEGCTFDELTTGLDGGTGDERRHLLGPTGESFGEVLADGFDIVSAGCVTFNSIPDDCCEEGTKLADGSDCADVFSMFCDTSRDRPEWMDDDKDDDKDKGGDDDKGGRGRGP
jgi:hypothetical protein